MRGSFRFVVQEVLSIFPYHVAIVDELVDEPENQGKVARGENVDLTPTTLEEEEDDEEEDDDADLYSDLSPQELTFRCLNSMQTLVKMRLQANQEISPLEKDILSTFRSGTESIMDTAELEQASAEEMAAMLEIFRTELVEMTDVTLRRYAIGMMMCEVGDLTFEERCEALRTTNGMERMRKILAILERKISLERAMSMAQQIMDTSADEDKKQLKIGEPSLPPWAKQIKKGAKVEYYWSEEIGWCRGTVKNVTKVVDEILVTVEFDDGETNRLPFNGAEKARWRPAV